METFTAVLNVLPEIAVITGRQHEERTFTALEPARQWIKEKRCGGAIRRFDGVDVRIIERIPPG
jgi:hypothetical protein